MSRSPVEVILGPVITERAYQLQQEGRYTFRVALNATKPEIARAIEEHYGNVKVASVNTARVRGRVRRSLRRGVVGRTPDWKKAVVTFKEGRLEGLFGGV
jgi:large subunit ribosomal protein L23